MTFDQVNRTKSVARTVHNGNLSLGFAEGVMHDVFVSSIVGGGEHVILSHVIYEDPRVVKPREKLCPVQNCHEYIGKPVCTDQANAYSHLPWPG